MSVVPGGTWKTERTSEGVVRWEKMDKCRWSVWGMQWERSVWETCGDSGAGEVLSLGDETIV